MTKVLVLIDADPLVYRVGFSLERRTYYLQYVDVREGGDTLYSPVFHNAARRDAFIELMNLHPEEYVSEMVPVPERNEAIVYGRVKSTLKDIRHNVGAYLYQSGQEIGEVRMYLSGATNFRNQIATITTYKGSRKDSVRPFWYEGIREYLIKQGALLTEGIEADDAVAIEQASRPAGEAIIATIDKDLLMIPGHHYNYHRKTAQYVKPGAAMRAFYRQVCMGDKTDDIPGCFLVGEAGAKKIIHDGLRNEKDMYLAALETYRANISSHPERHGIYGDETISLEEGAKGALLENARLLWMQRVPDELWNPPGTPNGSVKGHLEKLLSRESRIKTEGDSNE